MYRFMGCLGQLMVHSLDLQQYSAESLGQALLWITLKYFKNIYKYSLIINTQQEFDFSTQNDDNGLALEQKQAALLYQTFKNFLKQQASEGEIIHSHIKMLKQKIQVFYLNFQAEQPALKNLIKNFPEYFTPEYLESFARV